MTEQRRATPADYARIFVGEPGGQLILADLEQRFCLRWRPGGPEAAREMDRSYGHFEVVSFIARQINRASGAEQEDDNDDA